MPDPAITIQVTGQEAVDAELRCLIAGLSDRRVLHATIATEATEFTRDYLLNLNRHDTAARLGATPRGFRERNAVSLQPSSDADAAHILIPRNTGLGQAFHDQHIVPGTGKTFLTIADSPRTYGLHVRDFPEGTFEFAVIRTHRGPCPVMKFKDTGEIGYWLRRFVDKKQDRTLLPSDDGWRQVARRASIAYVRNVIQQQAA